MLLLLSSRSSPARLFPPKDHHLVAIGLMICCDLPFIDVENSLISKDTDDEGERINHFTHIFDKRKKQQHAQKKTNYPAWQFSRLPQCP